MRLQALLSLSPTLLSSVYASYHFTPRPNIPLAAAAAAAVAEAAVLTARSDQSSEPANLLPIRSNDDNEEANEIPRAAISQLSRRSPDESSNNNQNGITQDQNSGSSVNNGQFDDGQYRPGDYDDGQYRGENGNSVGGAAAIGDGLSSYATPAHTFLPTELASIAPILSSAGVTGLLFDSTVMPTPAPTGIGGGFEDDDCDADWDMEAGEYDDDCDGDEDRQGGRNGTNLAGDGDRLQGGGETDFDRLEGGAERIGKGMGSVWGGVALGVGMGFLVVWL